MGNTVQRSPIHNLELHCTSPLHRTHSCARKHIHTQAPTQTPRTLGSVAGSREVLLLPFALALSLVLRCWSCRVCPLCSLSHHLHPVHCVSSKYAISSLHPICAHVQCGWPRSQTPRPHRTHTPSLYDRCFSSIFQLGRIGRFLPRPLPPFDRCSRFRPDPQR